jgi:hypothetical protein
MAKDSPGTKKNVPPPDGCRWCGIEARTHFQRWRSPVGWHRWEAPTDEQRKARMLARRAGHPRSAGGNVSIVLLGL